MKVQLNTEGAIGQTGWHKAREPGALNYLPSRSFESLAKRPWQRFIAIIQDLVRDIWGVVQIRENSIYGIYIPVKRVEADGRSRK